MSRSNQIPLTIVNLHNDCLFQVFAHLNLLDLMNFRLQCSILNDAICKYLPHISKLAIVYTEHPIELKRKSLINRRGRNSEEDDELPFRAVSKPQSTDDRIYQTCRHFPQTLHFRSRDFIVISGRQNYEKFLEFVKKYEIRNIKKLAMIIDPKPSAVSNLWAAFELLQLCSKVETLLLERFGRWKENEMTMATFRAEDLKRLFNTIIGFSSLSELHFFSCPHSVSENRFYPTDTGMSWSISEVETTEMIGNFLSTMFQKLRIFSINYLNAYPNLEPKLLAQLLGQNFDSTSELGYQAEDCLALINSGTKFKNLRSLTLFGINADLEFGRFNIKNSFDQLTTLRFRDNVRLNKDLTLKLSRLPKLESLSASKIRAPWEFDGTVGDFYINRTIKHIQVEGLDGIQPSAGEVIDKDDHYFGCQFFPITLFFPNLLTFTVFKPEVHNTVYDGEAINDLQIL